MATTTVQYSCEGTVTVTVQDVDRDTDPQSIEDAAREAAATDGHDTTFTVHMDATDDLTVWSFIFLTEED